MNEKKILEQAKRDKNFTKELIKLLDGLFKLYLEYEGTEKQFMELFSLLGWPEQSDLTILDIIRHYKPEKKRFKFTKTEQALSFFNQMGRYMEFNAAIKNFKPRQKGKHGGLARYRDYFIEMKDFKAQELKDYKALIIKEKNDGLTEKEKLNLNYYKGRIPTDIKNTIKNKPKYTGEKGLATKWIAMELSCNESNLRQIIYNKS